MTTTAYIALGSNLGDRQGYLNRALQMLKTQPGIVVRKISSFYETAPVGGPPGQPAFLNGAAELETTLEPEALLRILLDVEQKLGRIRNEPDGPRIIDLDLLLFGNLVRQGQALILPHPRMAQRYFVLKPLAEIAPDFQPPLLGGSILDLLNALGPAREAGVSSAPELQSSPQSKMPARELNGMHALVTGSTNGIGFAIAMELTRAGAEVIFHGRGLEGMKRLREKRILNPILSADLRDPAECRNLAATAWALNDGLDIWINNAGADTLTKEAAHWPFERKLQELLDVDLKATMFLSRDIGARMQQKGNGVIVNIGWDQAETGMEGDSGQLFATTKSAVMAFTKSLALTLAPCVRVNCLAPGWIRTAWGESASERWQDRVRKETPLGRWGTPQDVAAAARWLVSPAAHFITGQVIRVNGGAVR
jgi:2-amino-4-hydroxy-6-hydroxymethyldihydropteridine diphosphokinase